MIASEVESALEQYAARLAGEKYQGADMIVFAAGAIRQIAVELLANPSSRDGFIKALGLDRAALLEATFSHSHKKRDGDDICAVCGLDLRDPIHRRVE